VRILVLHSRYATGSSSGENRVVQDEVELLRERGHEVTDWSPMPPEDRARQALLGARAVWSPSAVRELRAQIRSHHPDVIHVHNLFPLLSPAVLRTAAAPVVLTLHNYRLLCLPATFLRDGKTCEDCLGRAPWRGVGHRCYRGSVAGSASLAASITLHRRLRTFDRVARFLAVSEFVRDKYIEAGFDSGRMVVKPNFVPATAQRRGPGRDFLYLGRLSVEKGLGALMPIWAQVPARLLVVGDGPERAGLEHGAPGNVRFVGSVSEREVPDLLREARALVLPSICYEGAPRTVVEAFAAGVPVVGSRLGAIPTIVEQGVTGMLAAPGRRDEWLIAVSRLLDDADSERMGAAAHQRWSDRFSPSRAAAELESVYNAVLRQSQPRNRDRVCDAAG
jgi:glycosyltransferase involved in cell wall biosynthesis